MCVSLSTGFPLLTMWRIAVMKVIGHARAKDSRAQSIRREADPLLKFVIHTNIDQWPNAVLRSEPTSPHVVSEIGNRSCCGMLRRSGEIEDASAEHQLPIRLERSEVEGVTWSNFVGSFVNVRFAARIIQLMEFCLQAEVMREIQSRVEAEAFQRMHPVVGSCEFKARSDLKVISARASRRNNLGACHDGGRTSSPECNQDDAAR